MKDQDLFVYAGWLPDEPLIGVLHFISARGKEAASFEYDRRWIVRHPDLLLDPELAPFSGRQYPEQNKQLFGFLSDAMPDRWGRKLMNRREVIQAKREDRAVRKLMESDYLTGVHDAGRQGGLRFKIDPAEGFLAADSGLAAPPMTELRKLEQASLHYESSEDPYEEKWFRDLVQPGSSLGGARPKANVMDTEGCMWIAKFPSNQDTYNVGAWEMIVHDLAEMCGIEVPSAQLMQLSDAGATFLVKRFDRQIDDGSSRRIHFASAMTMLGQADNSEETMSYLDIAAFLEEYGAAAANDLRQLWKRIAFNIMVSNTDDHLRNHGFLLRKDGWHLSPAYDINPSYDSKFMALNINDSSNVKSLEPVIRTAEQYRYTQNEAGQAIEQIKTVIRGHWRKLAGKYHITKAEQDMLEEAFSEAAK